MINYVSDGWRGGQNSENRLIA